MCNKTLLKEELTFFESTNENNVWVYDFIFVFFSATQKILLIKKDCTSQCSGIYMQKNTDIPLKGLKCKGINLEQSNLTFHILYKL